MALATGTKLGPYEVLSALGAGGMGEVYRARDTRLQRDVAVKVLPDVLARDPDRLTRFEREAQAVAALSHPNILAIHDFGVDGSTVYAVTELLDGETLRARLTPEAGAKGPTGLPIRKVIEYGARIARGLAAAHGKGIVHRDLKPENIFITREGLVKILDFGLAKDLGTGVGSMSGQSPVPMTMAATLAQGTTPGTVLGTVGYMSPEQVRGTAVDHRSDLFAFGVVLYEMLTGRRAFQRDTPAETMTAILKDDAPELVESRTDVSPTFDRIVRHCLEKSPDERFQSARDVAFALEALSGSAISSASAAAAGHHRRWLRPVAALAFLAAALIVGLVVGRTMTKSVASPRGGIRFVFGPPEGTTVEGGPAAPQAVISPDGTRIVVATADAKGGRRLYLRSLESLEPRLLSGTDDGELPFWSPDGRSIAFFTEDRKLKRVPSDGGPVQTICELRGSDAWGGGAWGRDGDIVFSLGLNSPLYRVPAAGGTPVAIAEIDRTRQERAHLWPSVLPDGQRFLYLIHANDVGTRGLYVGSLESKVKTRLLDTNVRASFAPPNHLVFVREGTLMAQPFDVGDTRLTGEPVPIAEHVAYNPSIGLGRATFSVSNTGILVYRAGGVGGIPITQLTWFDRKGTRLGTVGQPGQHNIFDLSRDDARVATATYDPRARQLDLWVRDTSRDSSTRLTFDPSDDDSPEWSADGARIVFRSQRRGVSDVYVKSPTTGAPDELLIQSPVDKEPQDWSTDGRFLVYQSTDPKTGADLWLLPLVGDRTPRVLVQTPFQEQQAQISPDGRFIAYVSDESGTRQVYVQSFPSSEAKWQVSIDGGSQPRWRRDGRELFYLSTSQRLMAVDLKPGATFEWSSARELFWVNVTGFGRHDYAVSRDGQRFLVNTIDEQTGTAMTVVIDWLKSRD